MSKSNNRKTEFNWEGLAELAWRANQPLRWSTLNGYWDWDKLTDDEKRGLELRWKSLQPMERRLYQTAVEAACHAYVVAMA